ncbi:MAG: GvpL/GvpF family gas vesicle protein [Deltaproteobacteria bacterium]|nr:GvpL/GvpF family gas vesicle protein [Deltaproteobacteria bacterium]
MEPTGRYLYGLIRAAGAGDFGPIGLEHEGRPGRVHTVRVDAVGAVVSACAATPKLLPLRRNLEPHYRVIREVMKSTTIVPMAFGHVAASEAQIAARLREEHEEILDELLRLDGKVEMGLRVKWDVDDIFGYFVAADPELAALRDRLFGRSSAPSQAEKIELGRMFERRLAAAREERTQRVLTVLEGSCAEVDVGTPKEERVVAELSLLVAREIQEAFEKRIYALAATFPSEYVFQLDGPFAPFHFARLELGGAA